MSVCTGQCCTNIALSHSREEMRRLRDVSHSPEAALVFVLLRPMPGEDGGQFGPYRCVALQPAGCALSYDQRPWMCRAFPYGGDKRCVHCGAGSDAEARGVALVRTA